VFSMSSAPSSGATTGLCNSFLSNGSVNIPCVLAPRQWRHITVDREHVVCFLCGPCRGYIMRFLEYQGQWAQHIQKTDPLSGQRGRPTKTRP
jgi:hypothetical protein